MQEIVVREHYENTPTKTWNGHRLCTVDGTTLNLPNIETIKNHFQPTKKGKNNQAPQARASQLFDVLNNITIHSKTSPFAAGERELAISHLSYNKENDLNLYDRGYNGFEFMAQHRHRGQQYCIRAPISFSTEIFHFFQSGEADRVVYIPPSEGALKACKKHLRP